VGRSALVLGLGVFAAAAIVGACEVLVRPPVMPPATATFREIDGRETRRDGPSVTAPLTPSGWAAPVATPFGEVEVAFAAEPGAGQHGVYFPSATRVVQVALGEHVLLVDVTGRSDSPVGDRGPLLVTFPEGVVAAGENRLAVAVAGDPESGPLVDGSDTGGRLKALAPVFIGPIDAIRGAYLRREALAVSTVGVAIGAMIFGALLAALVAWGRDGQRRAQAVAALLVVWAALAALFLGADAALPFDGRFALYHLLRGALAALFVVFAATWAPGPLRSRLARGAARAGASGFGVLAVAVLVGTGLGAAGLVATTSSALVIAAMLGGIALLVEGTIHGRARRLVDTAPFVASALLLAADAAAELSRLVGRGAPLLGNYTSLGGLLAATSAIAALVLRLSDARRDVAVRSERLDEIVRDREAEIATFYEQRRTARERQALLEERQRILSDVHDGLGSQLLGLVLQARAERIDRDDLVLGLERSLDDLRLVVDSLDQVGDSLGTALGAFRARLEPRCRAAGIELVWAIEEVPESGGLGPGEILQVYRILQEAFVNAVRHGRARRIRIALSATSEGVVVTHHDEGSGFDPETVARRGLAGMSRRARAIGARLDVDGRAGGTRVQLFLPTSRRCE
jgi:two-component system sensor histidine kinase UhpB